MNNRLGVVVVAAGRGSRMGTPESKQFLLLQDKPVFIHTLETFAAMPEVHDIVLVTGSADVERCQDWIRKYGIGKVSKVIAGGRERQDSVYRGLCQLDTEWVMVHDGVRPFITRQHIKDCLEAAAAFGAAVLAVPVKDTIKQVNDQGIITATPERSSLWSIQTPQTFRLSELMEAHEDAQTAGFMGTDDAMLVERMGRQVAVAEGSYTNIKITTPEDLEIAAVWMTTRGEK
ncbi:2-C-methyl-D-erythritol 4-phosphate cytidylyltransferase [Paenibacillus sp. JX-17]|uniref:2-C-methyl-D-erythritol 4-phosphate cytidylyltransferase n=1 Tax=Paenibacillus lacisoli TaxID=3064525 RepID=A0ABT9CGH1_9BACL|nr:2-C-methyl-D-erythritol 4-phosphate cytidylyltransferase [Paenibacillus sp. JX-17]MDO7908375.1 2-C-methyl-D-erythritol 4-phosphate cytidylyltransferase [Paenibacillus sp. JX-17]